MAAKKKKAQPKKIKKLIADAAKAVETIPEDELEARASKDEACVVKPHFSCDGTGQMCDACYESEAACQCDEDALMKCKECDGTGQFCVTHQSPCGDLSTIRRCDKAKGKPK